MPSPDEAADAREQRIDVKGPVSVSARAWHAPTSCIWLDAAMGRLCGGPVAPGQIGICVEHLRACPVERVIQAMEGTR